jgi:dUTP pyrophosphatase
MQLKIKRLTQTAKLPERAFPTEAGLDVFADEDVTIDNGETVAISTGITLEIPDGYYGRLKARSGLTLNSALRVQEGTIDSSYRGEVKVIVEIKPFTTFKAEKIFYQFQPSSPFTIEKGMKIAQLIIQPLPQIELLEVDELSQSDRGANGFGSTGV